MSCGKHCAHIPIPMSGWIVSLITSFCSTNPQYLLFLSFSMLFWRTHFISLPAPMLYCVFDHFFQLHKSPIFTIFNHIFPCFSGGLSVSVRCIPNGMTAEPKSHGRPTKAKERVGRKSFSGCCLELARSDGMRQLPNLEIGASLALSLIIQASAVFGTSRKGRAGLSECFEVDVC